MAIKQVVDNHKRGNRAKKRNTDRGTEFVDSSPMIKLLGYKGLTPTKDAFIILKDEGDGYADMLTIRGQGVETMAAKQQMFVIEGYMGFLRAFLEDSKVIVSPFPADTSAQQRYSSKMYAAVTDRLRQTTDPKQRRQLQTRLRYINDQLQTNVQVEKELYNQEYILLIFGRNVRQLRDLRDNAIRWGGSSVILSQMDRKHKKEAMFRINNMNSRLR